MSIPKPSPTMISVGVDAMYNAQDITPSNNVKMVRAIWIAMEAARRVAKQTERQAATTPRRDSAHAGHAKPPPAGTTTAPKAENAPATPAAPRDDYWDENPDYPITDWQQKVNSLHTLLGYREWIEDQK